MKKFLSIVFIMLSVQVFAQTNPITAINITLPTNPDANTANWGTGTSVFIISASSKAVNGHTDPRVEESKLLVRITQNGKTVCGAYTSNTAPDAGFGTLTKVWSGGNAASFLGKDCTLAPGDYEVSVQFFGSGAAGTIPLSDEATKPFTIKGNEERAYQPPQGISPANGTNFSETDIKKPIIFRWAPVIPKPQDPVTYRLNIWQLMQGQPGAQAIKANQPIITKDVDNITQAVVTNIVTGPDQPAPAYSFVWNVQALNKDGKAYGANNGISEAIAFNFLNDTDVKNPADPGITIWDLCKRQTTTWSGIAAELNKISNCAVPFNGCTYDQIVTSPLYADILWYGNSSHVFSPSDQNSFIAAAKQWALANRPAGCNNTLKSVISITFITDFTVGDDEVNNKFITFSVKYGCCTGVVNQNHQQRVDLVSPVMNLNPGDTKPTFQWAVNNPQPGETYTVKLIETDEKQSPEEAIKTKTPVFEQSGIKEPGLAYPSSAKPLDPGKTYIWGVTVNDRSGKLLDGAFTKLLPLHTPGGTYNYCNQPVNITPNPVNACQGQQTNIQISSSITGYSWQISGPNGFSLSGTSSGTAVTVPFTPPSSGTYTVSISKSVYIPIPPFGHVYLYECGSGNFTVNLFPPAPTPTIDQAQICNGQAAMLSIPGLPAGYTIHWTWRDGCGPTGSGTWNSFLSGNYVNTNPISPACPPAPLCTPGQTYVSRYYQATIVPIAIGTPAWPCQPSVVPSIKVWCHTVAGTINGATNYCIAATDPSPTPTLTYAGGTYTTITWAGPNGPLPSTTNQQQVSVPTIAGSYTYTATVQNGPICSPVSASVTIKVENPLAISITGSNNNNMVCPNDNVLLSAHSTPAAPPGSTYKWEYQVNCQGPWTATSVNSSSQNTNPIGNMGPYSPVPATSLCWRVTVTTLSGICGPNVSPIIYQINIFQPPCTPVITAAGTLPKCPGTAVMLNTQASCGNSTTGPLTWQWSLNGILIPGATGASYSATLPGNYTVVVKNPCGSETRTSAPFAVTDCINLVQITGPCSTAPGSAITLTASATNPPCWGTNYHWQWYVNGAIIPGATGTTLQVAPPIGITTYSVVETSSSGCQSSALFPVKVCQP